MIKLVMLRSCDLVFSKLVCLDMEFSQFVVKMKNIKSSKHKKELVKRERGKIIGGGVQPL